MAPILDLPNIKKRTHLLSVEEYHKLGELGYLPKRTELIEGVVLHKMPKSPQHATLVKKIYNFFNKLHLQNLHAISEQPLSLARSEPEPDIAIVRGTIEDFQNSHPRTAELVIEVSLSSLHEDREMASIYAEAIIPEYWLFNLNNSTLEVYSKPMNGRYSEMKTYQKDSSISPLFQPSLAIDLRLFL